MGIVVTNKINHAFEWSPPPWLGALESVTIINPLALGVSKFGMAQYAVMAPLVSATVQLASTINRRLADPLQQQFGITPLITRLGVSLGLASVGIKVYPKVFKTIANTGIFGEIIQQKVAKGAGVIAGSSMLICARGCSPGSIICLSETAELLGGLFHWLKTRLPLPNNNTTQSGNN
jgi:hypothetical protein